MQKDLGKQPDEFEWHSTEFVAALGQRGMLLEKIMVPGRNHFEIIETFADARTPLHATVLGHIAPPA